MPPPLFSSDPKTNESISLLKFISETSEGVSSLLHSGIMKAARKVVLDEIVGNIIAGFITMKKSEKQLKVEQTNQTMKGCSLDCRMVMKRNGKRKEKSSVLSYFYFVL